MSNLNLPILIYLSKKGCPGCIAYESEWNKVKQVLKGQARFVKFTCEPGVLNVPPPLAIYGSWFPSIVLAGPKSYYRCFTNDDHINTVDWDDNYTIKGKKFNAVYENDRYTFGGRPNTADNTVLWFNQVVNSIPKIDEQTLPKKY